MSSAILRGGDLIVNEQGIRDAVRQVLRAAVERVVLLHALRQRRGPHRAACAPTRPACSTATSWPRSTTWSPTVTAQMDAYDLFGACASVRGLPRRAHQLVHPPQPRPLLGRRRRRLRHAVHRAARPHPGGGAAAAARHRGDLPGPHRRAQRAPRRLARRRRRSPADADLVAAMDRVRDVCSAALSIRKAQRPAGAAAAGVAHRRRRRTPTRWRRSPTSSPDEVNVKEVELTDDVGAGGAFELQVVPAALGPRLGADMQQVIRAVQGGRLDRGRPACVTAGGVELLEGEYALRLRGRRRRPARRRCPATPASSLLDTDVTPELEAEGQARDLVRAVQQARRDAGLHVSDRIRLGVRAPAAAVARARAVPGASWPTRSWRRRRPS